MKSLVLAFAVMLSSGCFAGSCCGCGLLNTVVGGVFDCVGAVLSIFVCDCHCRPRPPDPCCGRRRAYWVSGYWADSVDVFGRPCRVWMPGGWHYE